MQKCTSAVAVQHFFKKLQTDEKVIQERKWASNISLISCRLNVADCLKKYVICGYALEEGLPSNCMSVIANI
jgi:hypothetical protein